MDSFAHNIFGGLAYFFTEAYIWFPLIGAIFGWYAWRRYLLHKFVLSVEWVYLEIRLAKENLKSPQSMEVVYSIMNQPYESTWWERFKTGFVRTAMSLELISTEGQVRFIIRVEKNFQHLLESSLYAQHVGIEIFEVEDYMYDIDFPHDDWQIKAWHFALEKEDAYPIATYIDFGLDKVGDKEEARTDPLASTIEVLSRAGKGEHMWIQIGVQATKRKVHRHGFWFKTSSWQDDGKELVKKLMAEGKKEVTGANGQTFTSFPDRSKALTEVIAAVERNISKPGFDCVLRMMYLAKPEVANTPNSRALSNVFKQYDTLHLNKFKFMGGNMYDFPWQDPTGHRTKWLTEDYFHMFRERTFFRWPHVGAVFVLNTEELATIYHLPGGTVTTPSLSRVASQKAGPPSNLPK